MTSKPAKAHGQACACIGNGKALRSPSVLKSSIANSSTKGGKEVLRVQPVATTNGWGTRWVLWVFSFPKLGRETCLLVRVTRWKLWLKRRGEKKRQFKQILSRPTPYHSYADKKMKIASQVISITCFAEGEPDKFSQASEWLSTWNETQFWKVKNKKLPRNQSWWLNQPIWKISIKLHHLPQGRDDIFEKNVRCHHLETTLGSWIIGVSFFKGLKISHISNGGEL